MSDQKKADAHPTKEFFLLMLTRDIELSRAILELVDNSVDGARRHSPHRDYTKHYVKLSFDRASFVIEDNCGGIPIEVAEKYAFRFGRDPGMPPTPNSVGQFGVGMKRALFKLGRKFKVESFPEDEPQFGFEVPVEIDSWLSNPSEWTFPMDLVDRGDRSHGTFIKVENLNEGVNDKLEDSVFESGLILEIERVHAYSLSQGLKIEVNQKTCASRLPQLIESDTLKPGQTVFQIPGDGNGKKEVDVRLVAGLTKVSEERQNRGMRESGWYVFCNDRMVLEADQVDRTGWGLPGVPKWHPQYRHFRGFAFLQCEDAGRLPWNTTKSDVVLDSPIYQAVLQQMVETMKPVIRFLDRLDGESKLREDEAGDNQDESTSRPATDALNAAEVMTVSEPAKSIKEGRTFAFTPPNFAAKIKAELPKTGRIQYDAPLEKIKAVQKYSGLKTYGKIGEYTFDYFFKSEIED